MKNQHLHVLVMAGGSGTRFWPASRRQRPKQLLPIAPDTTETLIESTIRRVLPVCPEERILVVTGEHLEAATRAVLARFPSVRVVAEPAPRNTAPCIGWGTMLLERGDPEAIVAALPSDHHIRDEARFVEFVELATESASRGPITTIGIAPARPETGYGHIEAGEEAAPGVRKVVRFVEKPDRQRAEEYTRSGRYFWNSGMFFFRADVMRKAISSHLPDLAAGLGRIAGAHDLGVEQEATETRAVFPTLPSISVDYGIMEKVTPIHVVPADFGWSDVGSWPALWDLSNKDAAGNVADPSAVLVDSSGNLVLDFSTRKSERMVALVGIRDSCIIQTDDALLVIPRERAQEVRIIVEELQRRGARDKL